jgi:hypothetical protein
MAVQSNSRPLPFETTWAPVRAEKIKIIRHEQ